MTPLNYQHKALAELLEERQEPSAELRVISSAV